MAATYLNRDQRDALKVKLDLLEKAKDRIHEMIRPQLDAIDDIDAVCEALLEEHDAEIAGVCEGCSLLLFSGDRGYSYEDGPICCAECAPTWADAEENWKSQAEDDPERAAEFAASLAAHLAAGGAKTDRLDYEL